MAQNFRNRSNEEESRCDGQLEQGRSDQEFVAKDW
jgi:hypothetical protein